MYRPAYILWDAGEAQSGLRTARVCVFSQTSHAGGPLVFWEVRTFVEAIGLPKTGYWHRWYKDAGAPPDLGLWCATLGIHISDWRVSQKQAKALGWSASQRRFLLREVTASSTMLVLHLLDWSSRLRGKRRGLAVQCLKDLLQKVLSGKYGAIRLSGMQPPPLGDGGCAVADEHEDEPLCRHCADAFTNLSISAEASIADTFHLLLRVWSRRRSCGAMHRWAKDMIAVVARCLDACFSDEHEWPIDPRNAPAPRSHKRRMRLDPDVTQGAILQRVKNKRFRNTSAIVKAGDLDLSRRSAREAEDKLMMRYAHATAVAFGGARRSTLAVDESVVGGEATMVGALHCHDAKLSAWAVPQVDFVRAHRRRHNESDG